VPICLEGLRKTTKRRSESSQSCGRDLNPESPEYKAGVLITRLLFSVRNLSDTDFIIIPSGGMTVSDTEGSDCGIIHRMVYRSIWLKELRITMKILFHIVHINWASLCL
jgi:hypothetical protein